MPVLRLKVIPCAVTFALFFSFLIVLKMVLFAAFGVTVITVNAVDGTHFVQLDELIDKSLPIAVQQVIGLITSIISGFIFGLIFAVVYNLFVRVTGWRMLQASIRE
jgi:hypothetical protein